MRLFMMFLFFIGTPTFAFGYELCVRDSSGIICPGKSNIYKQLSTKKPMQALKRLDSKSSLIGEKKLGDDSLCKVVYFNGVKNVFCNGQLYAESYAAFQNTEISTKPRNYIKSETYSNQSYDSLINNSTRATER